MCVLIIPTKSGINCNRFVYRLVRSFVQMIIQMLWTDWDEIVMVSCAVVSVAKRFDFEPQTHIGRNLNNRKFFDRRFGTGWHNWRWSNPQGRDPLSLQIFSMLRPLRPNLCSYSFGRMTCYYVFICTTVCLSVSYHPFILFMDRVVWNKRFDLIWLGVDHWGVAHKHGVTKHKRWMRGSKFDKMSQQSWTNQEYTLYRTIPKGCGPQSKICHTRNIQKSKCSTTFHDICHAIADWPPHPIQVVRIRGGTLSFIEIFSKEVLV